MNAATARVARFVGLQLAVVSAAVHLWVGLPRSLVYLRAGVLGDVRMHLFVAGAVVVLLAVGALVAGGPRRPLYAVVLAVLVGFSVGYVAWHVTGHGGVLPGRVGYGHSEASLAEVRAHLESDPLAFVAMAAQVGATACLGALAVAEPERE